MNFGLKCLHIMRQFCKFAGAFIAGALGHSLGWYSAQRGMDMQGDAASKAFAMGLINAGAGFVGGMGGAAGQIAKSEDEE